MILPCYVERMNHSAYNPPTRPEEGGFNLIESAVILAVIGLVVGGIWVAASALSQSRKKAELQSAIPLMVDGTRALFTNQMWPTNPAGQTDITATLIASGKIPGSLLKNGSLTNPLSGTTFIVTLLYPPLVTNRAILITGSGLNKAQADATLYAYLQGMKSVVSYAYCSDLPETTWWVYNPPVSTPWPPSCPATSTRATVYYAFDREQY